MKAGFEISVSETLIPENFRIFYPVLFEIFFFKGGGSTHFGEACIYKLTLATPSTSAGGTTRMLQKTSYIEYDILVNQFARRKQTLLKNNDGLWNCKRSLPG